EVQQSIELGASQWQLQQCTVCHGSSGGGGIGPNLQTSNIDTVAELRSKIDLTMPQTNPSACKDNASSTCATDIANYVFAVFQQGQSSLSTDPDADNDISPSY
ncbi:MAG: hypothetical protein IIC60_14435, partial [Proteobacteria bacterium]|nr:hypothetical protein [Pseudomonadota bacterium]